MSAFGGWALLLSVKGKLVVAAATLLKSRLLVVGEGDRARFFDVTSGTIRRRSLIHAAFVTGVAFGDAVGAN